MENCLHPPPILGLDTDVIKIMMKNPTGSSNGGDELRDNDELKASRSSDFDVTQFCDKENEMKQIQFFENMQKDGRAFQITMNTILCCLFLKIMGNIT